MEIPTMVFMFALFIASLLKKEKHKHQIVLSCLIVLVLISLGIDVYYNLAIATGYDLAHAKELLNSEYILIYAVIIGAHYFLLLDIEQTKRANAFFYFLPAVYTLLNVGFIFWFGEEKAFYIHEAVPLTSVSVISLAIKLSILFIDFFITLYYRKNLAKTSVLSHICYQIIPIIVAFIDLFFNTSLIYIAIAVLLFIDYISVSYSQDMQLINQKRHLADQEKRIALEQAKITVSQIGPHFLYNAISSIMALCKKIPKKQLRGLRIFRNI